MNLDREKLMWERDAHREQRERAEQTRIRSMPSRAVAELLTAPPRDLCTEREWWVWLRAGDDLELEFVDAHFYSMDEEPTAEEADEWDELCQTWWWYMRDAIGIDEMLDAGRADHETWLLREGLAPGQPFLARFYGYWQTRSYDGEYDEGCEYEIVCAAPWSPAESAAAWERWLLLGEETPA